MDMTYKDKKIIVFDLDDTLSVTKTPISSQISKLLVRLLDKFDVCVISGSKFEQMKFQVLDQLDLTGHDLSKLHLMPTCGTQYYLFDSRINNWKLQYEDKLSIEQKERIFKVMETSVKELGYWENNPYGNILEDRGSQITYSALGQQAPVNLKYNWDPTNEKRRKICDYVSQLLPGLEVRIAGTTSIDITMLGIDKSYGIKKLIEKTGVSKTNILFIGDKMQIGGNDYPVKAMGIDTIEVSNLHETALDIESLLGLAK